MSGYAPQKVELPFGEKVAGRELPSVLAIDPGGTTGWVMAFPYAGDNWVGGELGPHPHHLELLDLLYWACPAPWVQTKTQIVCESFEFRQHYSSEVLHSRDKVELVSLEYIGIIKLFAARANCGLSMHTASSAKGFVSDEKLKRMGLYKPTAGKPHMRDALRHLVRYMVVDLRVHAHITDTWFDEEE